MTEAIEPVEGIDDVLLPEDQAAEDQTTNEADGDEEPEAQPEPKPKKTAQDRINELTRKAREAEREREYWREAAMRGQPAPQQRAAPEQPRDEAPHPDDFKYGDADPEYLVALAEHRAVARVTRQFEAQQQARTTQEQVAGFIAKESVLFPEGESEGLSAYKALPKVRPEIQDVVLTDPKGPLIAEYLGDNPSALRRLEGLPAHMVGFELARIEAALSAPVTPPLKRVTNAPDPAPKPRGQGGQFAVSPETSDFAAFERLADKVRSS